MNDDSLFAKLRQQWDNNQRLWDERVTKDLLIPLDARGGLRIQQEEDAVAITALGPSMETFRAVQRLCDPRADEALWADGFVLTRNLFETSVTLEWIKLDRKERAQLFQDDFVLKRVHFMKMVGDDQVRPEKRAEICSQHEDVIRRRGCGPDKQSLLPHLAERVREVATSIPTEQPPLQWEYDMYYRDVSGFAHPSGWGMWSTLPRRGGPIELKSNPLLASRC